MQRRSWTVWSALLIIVLTVSLMPQAALAADEPPDSPIVSPACYHADFGDLPDTYNTTRGNNGAYHDQGTLRLGVNFDWEDNGNPSTNAAGDDTHVGDDEDGVLFQPPARCSGSTLTFTVEVTGGSGKLGAWFDWNQNGVWDTGEGTKMAVAQGANTVTVTCPADFNDKGVLNARFRLYSGSTDFSNINPSGGVVNGEVEDYSWTFSPTAVRMVNLGGGAGIAPLQALASLALVATAVVGFGETRKRLRTTKL